MELDDGGVGPLKSHAGFDTYFADQHPQTPQFSGTPTQRDHSAQRWVITVTEDISIGKLRDFAALIYETCVKVRLGREDSFVL
jgi:hypothetical protein